MDIYTVAHGEDINTIANKFAVSVSAIVQVNGLENQERLVEGQALIITYPTQTHTVEEGDSLSSIAQKYNVTVSQLLRNNSFLSEREYIFPGESLVISYNTSNTLAIAGYAFSFIDMKTLKKTLPYLTYLNVINYQIIDEGKLASFYDTSEIVNLSISYGSMPLMAISALNSQGVLEYELLNNILTNQNIQEQFVNNILEILHTTDYYGVNIFVSALSESNQMLYFELLTKLSDSISKEGYLLFFTVDPNLQYIDSNLVYQKIEYAMVGNMIDGATFINELWASYQGPPTPITSVSLIKDYMAYILPLIAPEKVFIDIPLIAYDWELPYNDVNTTANFIGLDSVMSLALDVDAVIQFDEESQTPFFLYKNVLAFNLADHIVWFVDARTFHSMLHLAVDNGIAGVGVWNVMSFCQPLWSVLVSQFNVEKLLPEP